MTPEQRKELYESVKKTDLRTVWATNLSLGTQQFGRAWYDESVMVLGCGSGETDENGIEAHTKEEF